MIGLVWFGLVLVFKSSILAFKQNQKLTKSPYRYHIAITFNLSLKTVSLPSF